MAVQLIKTKRFGDERGWFTETYSQRRMSELGIDVVFKQDNHSMSQAAGVVRGLHYQCAPHAQAKLVRCVRGRIWDVAVDIRRGSPTYGHWVGAELSAEDGLQVYIPIGFAHGFVTLEPNSEVQYKASDFYAPETEGGILWNDADIGIRWPIEALTPVLSPKDEALPRLRDLSSPFDYDGAVLAPLEV